MAHSSLDQPRNLSMNERTSGFDVALTCSISSPTFDGGNDLRKLRWISSRSFFSTMRGRCASAMRTSARIADLPESFDRVKLQPDIAAVQDAQQIGNRRGVPKFSERGDDRRGDVDIRLVLQRLAKDVEAVFAAQIAEQIDQRQANVGI